MFRTDVGVRARRAVVAGLLGTLAIALLAAFAVVNFVGGGDDGGPGGGHGRGAAEQGPGSAVAPGAEERAIGEEQVARAGGREARLQILGEVPEDTHIPRGAVPARTPLRLVLDVAEAGPRAEEATLEARTVTENGAPSTAVALDRRAAFLLDTRTGDLVLPTGATAVAGAHAHGGAAPADPGSGLAGLSPGGGFAWAAKLPSGAGAAVAHDGGRFLAVPYPGAGRVELVDLLRRTRAGGVRVGERLGPLAFERSGRRLWAVDEAGGRLLGIDPRTRAVVARVPVGRGRAALAVDDASRQALVATPAGATLVDLRAGRRLDARPLAPAVAAVAAPAAASYALAHAEGRLSVLPARDGRLGAPRMLRTGAADAGTRTVGLAPDGRTAIVLNEDDDAIVLVDLAGGRLVRRVEAPAPRDLQVFTHFALARSASGTQVTWVDLDTPSRSNVLDLGAGRGLSGGLEGGEALAPSPADRQVYRIHAMHGRPIVVGEIANTIGADVTVVSSGVLRATAPGVLEQRTVLDRAGRYRLVLRVPGGAAFPFELRAAEPQAATRARPARRRMQARVGDPLAVRFTVTGAAPSEAQVLAYGGRAGAPRQLQVPARRVGSRAFEATLRFPVPGTFRLELLSEEAGLRPAAGTGAVVRVRPAAP